MTEIFEGLDGDQRDRIAALRKVGRFFWIDIPLSEASADDLGDVLDVPKDALQALLTFGRTSGPPASSTPMGSTSASPSAVTSSPPSSRMTGRTA